MEQLTPLINALKRYWKADLRRLTFLAALVMALVTARTTSGPRLALSLGSIASPDPRSAYRRFQRFLAWPGLDGEGYARFIFALLRPQGLLLVMDRTEWELGKSKVNLLMLAFLYQGLAVPLFWSFLPHDGNSSTPERIALMERALAFLRAHFPHLRVEGFLADREFIGEAWFRYLEEKGIPRCIRIKANTRMWRLGSGPRAWELFASLKVGESRVPRRRYWVYGRRMWVVGLRLGVREWLIVATQNLHLFTAGMSMLGDHLKRATGFPSYEGCHETSSPIPTLDHPGPHANPPPAGILEGPVVPFPHRSRQG